MGQTKRRPINRPVRRRITPEVVELFATGFDIAVAGADKTWEAQGGRRREFLDTCNALDAALGLSVDERGPLSCHDGLPPRWVVRAAELDSEKHILEGWKQAVETRRLLVAALIERRGRTRVLVAETERMYREVEEWKRCGGDYPATAGMLTKGQDVLDWMERFIQIPEGKFIGRRLELLDFQKDIVRRIYDNDCKRGERGVD
jgi:hypothetical protein